MTMVINIGDNFTNIGEIVANIGDCDTAIFTAKIQARGAT